MVTIKNKKALLVIALFFLVTLFIFMIIKFFFIQRTVTCNTSDVELTVSFPKKLDYEMGSGFSPNYSTEIQSNAGVKIFFNKSRDEYMYIQIMEHGVDGEFEIDNLFLKWPWNEVEYDIDKFRTIQWFGPRIWKRYNEDLDKCEIIFSSQTCYAARIIVDEVYFDENSDLLFNILSSIRVLKHPYENFQL